MRRRRTPEIIAGRVNADGSIAAGDGFTVQKTGTGAYTITFPSGFRLIAPNVFALTGGSAAWGNTFAPGERSFVLNMFVSNTGAVADGSFCFTAVGVQQ